MNTSFAVFSITGKSQMKASYKGCSASLFGTISNGNTNPVEGAVITSADGRYTD